MDWIEISVVADAEAAEAVSELFNRINGRPDGQGGAAIEISGFDPVAEAHQAVFTVRTYLPARAEGISERRRRIEEGLWFLGRIYPLADPVVRLLAEEDWANAWKAHYEPLRIGRHFIVIPAWLQPGALASPDEKPGSLRLEQGDHPLILDPGMAFGTGLHPSTQLCLAMMEDTLRAGDRVLDAGCGSGILSIAAARLGAAEVWAFDIDPIAVAATGENAALNDLPIPIHVFESSGPDGGKLRASPAGGSPYKPANREEETAIRSFDVILVNILLPVIVELLDGGLARCLAPGGRMILSGVIAEQEPQLLVALSEHGLALAGRLQQGDWIAACTDSLSPPNN
jgi:ribosomal protein L11 methyltransferase